VDPNADRGMRRLLVPVLLALALATAACSGGLDADLPALSPTATEPTAETSAAPPASIAPFDPNQDRVVQVVERVLPAVVSVVTDALVDAGGAIEPSRGTGTGFVVRADGVIVTNCHVVEGARRITVIVPARDGEESPARHDARVIGHDCEHDLAVLKVDAQGLPTLPIGGSDRLRLGQSVVALGYALRLEGGPTVTSGIVSALDRVIEVEDPNFGVRTYTDVIQTDAAINPGNSGGPLVDLAGRVVGINSAGVGAQAAENIGFAIAIDSAKPAIDRAIADPEAPVAYLGVFTQDVTLDLAFQLDLPVEEGAYIVDVSPGGPAETAGIEAGGVIVGFDGQEVTGQDQLGELIHAHRPGEEVEVEVVAPDGDRLSITVELGLNPGPILE
jgi:serine protease Do